MDFYRVTLTQGYFGQLVLNNFYYYAPVSITGGNPAELIAQQFGYNALDNGIGGASTVLGILQGLQVTALNYITLDVVNLYSPTDFANLPFDPDQHGGNQASGASPVISYGFNTTLTRRDIRRGQRRFAGVAANAIDAGGLLNGGTLGQMRSLADAMQENLLIVAGGTNYDVVPAILGVEKYTTPSGSTAYRNYLTAAEQAQHISTGFTWIPKIQVRTQNSRQYAKGA